MSPYREEILADGVRLICGDCKATTIYEVRISLGDGWFYRDWYGREAMAFADAQEARKAGREVQVIAITYDDVEAETVVQSINLTQAEKSKPPIQGKLSL